jgi:YspA, cpYpsA-related SLOG family
MSWTVDRELRDQTCRRCENSFVSDRTPMAVAGFCMMCRPHVTVSCIHCGAECPGAFDGQQACTACRSERYPAQVVARADPTPATAPTSAAPSSRTWPRRILVTGSRTRTATEPIREALAAVWHPQATLVTGACKRGADHLCEQCWSRWGGQVERHPAEWRVDRRGAGMLRNVALVELGADVCVAFIRDGSPGATHCAATAEAAGIPTFRIHQRGRDITGWEPSVPTWRAAA